jgi:hypothetical protein
MPEGSRFPAFLFSVGQAGQKGKVHEKTYRIANKLRADDFARVALAVSVQYCPHIRRCHGVSGF